jgi:hypothetical protein
MTWWAVSDASEERLRQLARLLGAPLENRPPQIDGPPQAPMSLRSPL